MKNEKDMIKWLNNLKSDIGQPQHSQLWHYAEILDVIARYLENTERTGEWIPEFDGKFTGGAYWFSCSKCKRIVPEVRNGGWNFCPNCGAMMKGGIENDR